MQLIPTLLKADKYNEWPSVQWLLKVNDFMELNMPLSSKVRSSPKKERRNSLVLSKNLMYRSRTEIPLHTVLHRFTSLGVDRNLFFLVLGLNLGLLSFPSIPKQSVVIYYNRTVPYLVEGTLVSIFSKYQIV